MLEQTISKRINKNDVGSFVNKTLDLFIAKKLENKGIKFWAEEKCISFNHKRYRFCEKMLPLILSEINDKELRRLISNLFILKKDYSKVREIVVLGWKRNLLPKEIRVVQILNLKKEFYVVSTKGKFIFKEVRNKKDIFILEKDFLNLEDILEKDLRTRIS